MMKNPFHVARGTASPSSTRQNKALTFVLSWAFVLVSLMVWNGITSRQVRTTTQSTLREKKKQTVTSSTPTNAPNIIVKTVAVPTTAPTLAPFATSTPLTSRDARAVAADYLLCPSLNQTQFKIQGRECDNEDYWQTFAPTLYKYVKLDPVPFWAVQPNLNPPLSSLDRNQTWLFVGTLQHRSIAMTLACQIAQLDNWQLDHMQMTDRFTNQIVLSNAVDHVSMTLWIISDTYAVFSQNHWAFLLQKHMQGFPLEQADLIVVGTFHQCKDNDTTNFSNKMNNNIMKIRAQVGNDLDCINIKPPSVEAWRSVYKGPLLFIASAESDIQAAGPVLYKQVRHYHEQQDLQQQSSAHSSTPVLLGIMPASYHQDQLYRMHALEIGGGGYLSSPCLGPLGGFWDLLAWEVMDFWQYAQKNGDKPQSSLSNDQPHQLLRHWQLPQPMDSKQEVLQQSVVAAASTHNDFHYCADLAISFFGDAFSPPVPVSYRCEGTMYDDFVQMLQQYIYRQDDGTWGKRPWPLPENSRVLVFGNSHTRQVAEAWTCMYGSLLTEIVQGPFSWWYHFANNASLAVVVNSPIPFSSRWVERLHEEIGVSSVHDTFDAIVLGMNNNCKGDNNFAKGMKALSRQMPDVDCLHNAMPTLTNWTQQVFPDKPIVFLPMMSLTADHTHVDMEMQQLRTTTNQSLSLLDARHHIDAVGIECASFNRTTRSDCLNNSGATHRCQGTKGSHPDLIAWSVIDHLYGLLGSGSEKVTE